MRLRLFLWQARVLILLCALPLALRLLPVRHVTTLLTPRTPHHANFHDNLHASSLLESIVWWVDRVIDLRPLRFWGHCLRRSLVLYYVSQRLGYPSRIVFGVRRLESNGLSGHGWLELDGAPFLEPGPPPDITFAVMWRLP